MSSVVISGDTSGAITLQAPAVSGNTTLNLPTVSGGTLVTSNSSGNVGIGGTGSGQRLFVDSGSYLWTAKLNSSNVVATALEVGNSTTRTWEFAVGGSAPAGTLPAGGMYFYDQSAGQARFIVDTGGRITSPFQPAACIRTDVTYNAPASDTKMVFTSPTTNIGSHYSTSTGRFTAPVAGTYFFYTSMHTNGTGSGRHTIRRNGTQFFGATVTSTSWSNACCAGFITMAENDYLEIWCSAGAYIHGDPNWGSWGIRLIG